MSDAAHHPTNAGSEVLAAFIRQESFSITGGVNRVEPAFSSPDVRCPNWLSNAATSHLLLMTGPQTLPRHGDGRSLQHKGLVTPLQSGHSGSAPEQ